MLKSRKLTFLTFFDRICPVKKGMILMKNEMLNEMKLDAILKNDKLSEEEKDQMINELFFSEDILPSEEDL